MLRRLLFLLVLVGLFPSPKLGAAPLPGPRVFPPEIPERARLGDPRELEAFVDGLVESHRRKHKTPGVVVTVFTRDQVLLAKGYGWADRETPRPVDPKRTVFRVGSISKVLTATGILILEDRGRISLADPVSKYLPKLRFPGEDFGPIRLEHLLTHTAGLDLILEGIAYAPGQTIPNLVDWVHAHAPRRLRPPGESFQYSNYGPAVLGAVIEAVSGESFEDFLAREVFTPLGLDSARFHPDPAQEPDLARAYGGPPFGSHSPQVAAEFGFAPAASLRVTATDLTRYLRAMLRDGELEGARILSRETTRKMRSTQFRLHPKIPGMAWGWFEGPRGVGHAGGTIPFLSTSVLLPDHGFGFFFSSNSLSGAHLFGDLAGPLLTRYAALEPEAIEPLAVPPPDPARERSLSGRYRWGFHPRGTALGFALTRLPAYPELSVEVLRPGVLTVVSGPGREPGRLYRQEDGSYLRGDGHGVVAFPTNPKGAQEMQLRAFLPMVLEKIPWWRTCKAFWFGLAFWLGLGGLLAVQLRKCSASLLPWLGLFLLQALALASAWVGLWPGEGWIPWASWAQSGYPLLVRGAGGLADLGLGLGLFLELKGSPLGGRGSRGLRRFGWIWLLGLMLLRWSCLGGSLP